MRLFISDLETIKADYNIADSERIYWDIVKKEGYSIYRLPQQFGDLKNLARLHIPDLNIFLVDDMNTAGIPDFLIYKDGYYCFVEIKKIPDGLSYNQLKWFFAYPYVRKKIIYINNIGKIDETRPIPEVIYTGFSEKKANYIKLIIEAMKAIDNNPDIDTTRGVHISDIVREAKTMGIGESDVRDAIKKMSQAGEVYSPSDDYYRISSR